MLQKYQIFINVTVICLADVYFKTEDRVLKIHILLNVTYHLVERQDMTTDQSRFSGFAP